MPVREHRHALYTLAALLLTLWAHSAAAQPRRAPSSSEGPPHRARQRRYAGPTGRDALEAACRLLSTLLLRAAGSDDACGSR